MGNDLNVFGDGCFKNFYDYSVLFDCIKHNNDIDCILSDSVKSFINWFNNKSDELAIPNEDLKNYLINFKAACNNDFEYMVKRMEDVMITDDFKALFPEIKEPEFKPVILTGSYGKESDNEVTFIRNNPMRKYRPLKNYNICNSFAMLFDYISYILLQTDDFYLPRIPALLGGSGGGKSYICSQTLPYYLNMKIKGDLYVSRVVGSQEDSCDKYFFKVNPSNAKEVFVGRIAEALMRSNECENEDDFFLVIYDDYTSTPLSAISEAFSALSVIDKPYKVGNKTFYRKPNLGIIMNGRIKDAGVDLNTITSKDLNSMLIPIYETPQAREDISNYLRSLM